MKPASQKKAEKIIKQVMKGEVEMGFLIQIIHAAFDRGDEVDKMLIISRLTEKLTVQMAGANTATHDDLLKTLGGIHDFLTQQGGGDNTATKPRNIH